MLTSSYLQVNQILPFLAPFPTKGRYTEYILGSLESVSHLEAIWASWVSNKKKNSTWIKLVLAQVLGFVFF